MVASMMVCINVSLALEINHLTFHFIYFYLLFFLLKKIQHFLVFFFFFFFFFQNVGCLLFLVLIGEWDTDMRQGFGTQTFSDGSSYKGLWEDDEMSG